MCAMWLLRLVFICRRAIERHTFFFFFWTSVNIDWLHREFKWTVQHGMVSPESDWNLQQLLKTASQIKKKEYRSFCHCIFSGHKTNKKEKFCQNKNAEDHAHHAVMGKTTGEVNSPASKTLNLYAFRENSIKNHVLAQEVNYIEWRFKLGENFSQQKKHFSQQRCALVVFATYTQKPGENDAGNIK